MKRAARVVVGLGFGVMCFLAGSPAALAHTTLVRSDPSDGASVSTSPVGVQLWFDEPVRLGLSSFRLSTLDGAEIAPTTIRPIVGNGVAVDVPALEHGVYDLSWSVVSSLDTHLTEGHVLFGIGTPVSAQARTTVPAGDPPVAPGEVILRWFDILAAALMIGALAVAGFVLRARRANNDDAGRVAIRYRVLGVAVWATVASILMGVALFAWQVIKIRGALPTRPGWWTVAEPLLLHGRWSALWWSRQVVLVAILIAAVSLQTGSPPGGDQEVRDRVVPQDRRLLWIITGGWVALFSIVWALGSHAASVPSSGVPVLVDAVHVLTASIWMGGLLSILLALAPVGRRDWRPADVRSTWRRFGWMAGVSLGLLVATGLLEAARQVASLDALLTTSYGRALMLKSGLLFVASVLALVNTLVLHPEMRARVGRGLGREPRAVHPRPSLPRLIAVEGVVGVLILLGAGLMASAPPARGAGFAPDAGPVASTQAREVDDLLVTLSVAPNLPGSNVTVADVVSTRRPAPAPIADVSLLLRPPDGSSVITLPLKATGPERYQGGGDAFDQPGAWNLDVVVQRDGLPTSTATFAWRVGDGAAARPATFSTRSLAGPFTVAAMLILLVLIAGVIVALRVRSRARRARPTLVDVSMPPPRTSVGAGVGGRPLGSRVGDDHEGRTP